MALDERIALTLYDSIYQVISGSDPDAGLPSAFNSATTAFVMAQRGMVLNGADFRNPWSPGNTEGSMPAAARTASLVDEIPGPGPVYAPIGGTVSDVYRKIIKGVQNHEPPPSPELEAKRQELKRVLVEEGKDDEGRPTLKPTSLADAEEKAFNNYQDTYTAYVGAWAAAQKDPTLKPMWPIVGAQALQKPKRAFVDWGAAGRDQVESTKAQLATLNEGQVARAFADAQFRLNAFEIVNDLTETFLRTNITPSDWASADASSWPSYHFNESTFASEFTTEATSWGGSANVQVGLWSFGGGVQHSDSRQAMSQDTTNIGVSFKWRVCPVYRKWMDASLFRLPNWGLGSLGGPGVISGGPNSQMPLIPIALVIVRDVEITADWSHQDSEKITEATSGSASVGWGPFAVSGNYSHSSTSDRFSAKASDKGFNVPDIQVLGFVCLRVPPCPPM
ncbi:hypothetical protein AB0H86_32850 [Streptomyces sp. NPDC050997]|uniref:hypothetical protein n=1 Tax=Streptomyces sp. NPDC050997 TaxID=3155519 RepID=UPI00343E5960